MEFGRAERIIPLLQRKKGRAWGLTEKRRGDSHPGLESLALHLSLPSSRSSKITHKMISFGVLMSRE